MDQGTSGLSSNIAVKNSSISRTLFSTQFTCSTGRKYPHRVNCKLCKLCPMCRRESLYPPLAEPWSGSSCLWKIHKISFDFLLALGHQLPGTWAKQVSSWVRNWEPRLLFFAHWCHLEPWIFHSYSKHSNASRIWGLISLSPLSSHHQGTLQMSVHGMEREESQSASISGESIPHIFGNLSP